MGLSIEILFTIIAQGAAKLTGFKVCGTKKIQKPSETTINIGKRASNFDFLGSWNGSFEVSCISIESPDPGTMGF